MKFASRFFATKRPSLKKNRRLAARSLSVRLFLFFVCFLFPYIPSSFPLSLLSSFLLFLLNPEKQSTPAEAETAELSSTLIRDRGTPTALTTPFDPSNHPGASGHGEYWPLGHLRHLCQKFERGYYVAYYPVTFHRSFWCKCAQSLGHFLSGKINDFCCKCPWQWIELGNIIFNYFIFLQVHSHVRTCSTISQFPLCLFWKMNHLDSSGLCYNISAHRRYYLSISRNIDSYSYCV